MKEQKKPQSIGQSVDSQTSPATKPISNFKPVLSAYLHEPVMMPGGQTESSLTQIKLPGIKLAWLNGEGLLVKHKNQVALIPAPNVAIAYMDSVEA